MHFLVPKFDRGRNMKNVKIILASQSPRRKELLSLMGVDFECLPSKKEEDMTQKVSITTMSKNLAYQKAKDVFDNTSGNRIVIGSDSMVYLKRKIFGKPKNEQDAFKMLRTLSNRWHRVITSLCVLIEENGSFKKYLTYEITKVKFMNLDDNMISEYLKNDEYKDKAGAYALQGISGKFVEKIKGNMSTVIGLPTCKLYKIFKQENIM